MKALNQNTATNIQSYRKKTGLTQLQLCNLIRAYNPEYKNFNQSTLSKLENGDLKISKELEMAIYDICQRKASEEGFDITEDETIEPIEVIEPNPWINTVVNITPNERNVEKIKTLFMLDFYKILKGGRRYIDIDTARKLLYGRHDTKFANYVIKDMLVEREIMLYRDMLNNEQLTITMTGFLRVIEQMELDIAERDNLISWFWDIHLRKIKRFGSIIDEQFYNEFLSRVSRKISLDEWIEKNHVSYYTEQSISNSDSIIRILPYTTTTFRSPDFINSIPDNIMDVICIYGNNEIEQILKEALENSTLDVRLISADDYIRKYCL